MIDFIIIAVIALIVGGVIFKLVRDRRAGKSGCGCGCDGCAMKDSCHTEK